MAAPTVADSPRSTSRSIQALVFVDTNVFLYALDEADSEKQRAAQNWRDQLWRSRRGRVSFQVLGEFYVNATRIRPAARNEACAEVRDLLAWNPVITDVALLERGWKFQDRYQLPYWDALIAAAAQASSCRYLLTEDFQAGQKLEEIEVVNPFLSGPESI